MKIIADKETSKLELKTSIYISSSDKTNKYIKHNTSLPPVLMDLLELTKGDPIYFVIEPTTKEIILTNTEPTENNELLYKSMKLRTSETSKGYLNYRFTLPKKIFKNLSRDNKQELVYTIDLRRYDYFRNKFGVVTLSIAWFKGVYFLFLLDILGTY